MSKKVTRNKSHAITDADRKKIAAAKKFVEKLHKAAQLAKAKYKAAKKALKLAKKEARARVEKSPESAPARKPAALAKTKPKKTRRAAVKKKSVPTQATPPPPVPPPGMDSNGPAPETGAVSDEP